MSRVSVSSARLMPFSIWSTAALFFSVRRKCCSFMSSLPTSGDLAKALNSCSLLVPAYSLRTRSKPLITSFSDTAGATAFAPSASARLEVSTTRRNSDAIRPIAKASCTVSEYA